MTKQRMQLNLLLIAVMFAGIVYLSMRAEQRVYDNQGRLTVREEAGAVVFIWKSGVEIPMARRFEEAFAEWRHVSRHIIIDLHSPGGSLREGEAVIQAINHMKQSHRVDTRVRSGRACLSMCVPIFLTGEERRAAPSSRWMFHEPTARDFFTGEEVPEPEFERRYASAQFVERYFTNSEMDPQWRESLVAEWKGKDVWKSGRDLANEGSGIITRLD